MGNIKRCELGWDNKVYPALHEIYNEFLLKSFFALKKKLYEWIKSADKKSL